MTTQQQQEQEGVWTPEAVAEYNQWLDDCAAEEDALLAEYDRIAQALSRLVDTETPRTA